MQIEEDTIDVKYVETVLDRTDCVKHVVPRGIPCWHIFSATDKITPAICNQRAREAGFNGKVSDKALRKS